MPKLWEALLTLAILIAALAVGIIIFGVDPHVPMFVGVMAAAIMALHLGYKWDEVEKSMMDGIYKALQSICILIIVGILIGVWINAGVVPTMIYYGLKVLNPRFSSSRAFSFAPSPLLPPVRPGARWARWALP